MLVLLAQLAAVIQASLLVTVRTAVVAVDVNHSMQVTTVAGQSP